HYFKERAFAIPFTLEPGSQAQQVNLYVSTDKKTYQRVATASPTDPKQSFVYTARADGWYFFVVQVEDRGLKRPANPAQGAPDLSVCVDTETPQVTLRPVLPIDGGTAAVEWRINDANIDLRTLRLEYRPAGVERWTALNVKAMVNAQFSWNTPSAGEY